jgi:dTDP-4-dehydrorhamnose 3,5-epimerase
MLIEQIEDTGIYSIQIEKIEDHRGVFSKLISQALSFPKIEEVSVVNNRIRGVLRGLHYQEFPYAESKVIVVLDGEIFDVLINLDSLIDDSPETHTFWLGQNHRIQGLVVPPNYAHGYLSTSSTSSILYAMDKPYEPDSARGLRWNDPALKIKWPEMELEISDRDKIWPMIERCKE